MKSNLLFITMVFMTIQLRAQYYCPFTYNVTPGTTDVAFFPNSYYPPGQYHFTWTFGDGGSSTLPNPTHTYTDSIPYYVQCFVYDAINNPVCSTGDSIYLRAPYSCGIRIMGPISVDSFAFATQPLSGAHIEWDFGDGTGIIPGNPVMHTYTQIGNFNCTCYHKDSGGNIMCQHSEIMTIHSIHGCYFSYAANGSNPYLIDFTAWTPAGYNVDWDYGDNSTGTGTLSQHFYSVPGIYDVCYVGYDSLGDSCLTCNPIQVGFSNPHCFFSAIPDSIDPLTVTFTDTTPSPLGSIAWDFGDQTFDSNYFSPVNHTYSMAGIYWACLDKYDSLGVFMCETCDSIFVGSPNCNFISTSDIVDPMMIIFAVYSSGYIANWDFGDGSFSTGSITYHTYAGLGTYQVCVDLIDTLTGIPFCSSCSPVQVNLPTSSCQAAFYTSTQGLTANFIDISQPDSTAIISYAWDFGDGSTSNVRFPQHTFQSPGVCNVCLTINTFSCTDSICDVFVVDTTTIINPVCNALYAIVQTVPYQVMIVDLSGGYPLSYYWDFGDGFSDTIAYPIHAYSTTGSYILCLTVSDPTGCSSTFCDTMNVDSLGTVSHIAQQGFTIVVVSPSDLTSAVEEINSSDQFNVYPNPVESELFLMSKGDSKMESYRILSMQGAIVSSGKIDGSNGKISMQKFSGGTYLLEVMMKDGARYFKAIIKN